MEQIARGSQIIPVGRQRDSHRAIEFWDVPRGAVAQPLPPVQTPGFLRGRCIAYEEPAYEADPNVRLQMLGG